MVLSNEKSWLKESDQYRKEITKFKSRCSDEITQKEHMQQVRVRPNSMNKSHEKIQIELRQVKIGKDNEQREFERLINKFQQNSGAYSGDED